MRGRFDTLKPRQNIFKFIYLKISLFLFKFHRNLPKGVVNSKPTLVQIMTWRRIGDKSLFGPTVFWISAYASLGLDGLNRNHVLLMISRRTELEWAFQYTILSRFNTLRPRHNGRHFTDDIFKAFSWMKFIVFFFELHLYLFPGVQSTLIYVFRGSICWYTNIGSDDGLVPNKRYDTHLEVHNGLHGEHE